MKLRLLAVICLMALISILAIACTKQQAPDQEERRYEFRKDGELEVVAPDGTTKARFDIEIVSTDLALMQGLKYRDKLGENQGMLFIMSGDTAHSFWMQDTYLSLDIIYIDHTRSIFQIYKNTIPFSEETLPPDKINKYTLELLAGSCDRLNIKEGDSIRWQEL